VFENADAILIVTTPPSVWMRRGTSRMRQVRRLLRNLLEWTRATRAIPKQVAELWLPSRSGRIFDFRHRWSDSAASAIENKSIRWSAVY